MKCMCEVCFMCRQFIRFTHSLHVSAVMSDFPSAEHWWIALGKISTFSLRVCLPVSCPHLQNIKTPSLFLSLSFSLSGQNTFSCSQTHYNSVPTVYPFGLGLFKDSCWSPNLPLIDLIFLSVESLSLQVRAWWWWYSEDSSWPINCSEATSSIQLNYRTSNEHNEESF